MEATCPAASETTSRARFASTKALFEQLEREAAAAVASLPASTKPYGAALFSPRPVRAAQQHIAAAIAASTPEAAARASTSSLPPPPLPKKPVQQHRGVENGKPPSPPMMMDSALAAPPPPSSAPPPPTTTSSLCADSSSSTTTTTTTDPSALYRPYWRDAAFYRRRLGVAELASAPSSSSTSSSSSSGYNSGSTPQINGGNNNNSSSSQESASPPTDSRSLSMVAPPSPSPPLIASGAPIGNGRPTLSSHGGAATSSAVSSSSARRRVSFSTAPVPVYETHSAAAYDRRNDEVDPVAACAEYELERRLERMRLFDVCLRKGAEGLGVSIIGMGVGADAGLEKLGIFVKSITPGGAVAVDGRIQVADQIVSVDGQWLVGVSQIYAAETLRATGNTVTFTIGREENVDDSEVAALINASLEADRARAAAAAAALADEEEDEDDVPEDGIEFVDDDDDDLERDERRTTATTNADCDRDECRVQPPVIAAPPKYASSRHTTNNNLMAMTSDIQSLDQNTIKQRIAALELELELTQRRAEQLGGVLGDTRQQCEAFERKYEQANQLLRNYQLRERELLDREEAHVEQLRTKDSHYAQLVEQLRSRIEELERKLNEMDERRTSVVDVELRALRSRLAESEATALGATPPPPPHQPQQRGEMQIQEPAAYRPALQPPLASTIPPSIIPPNSIPLNHQAVHSSNSGSSSWSGGKAGNGTGSACSSCAADSPVPRVSEPASPAMPIRNNHQHHHHHHHSQHAPPTRPLLLAFRKLPPRGDAEFWRSEAAPGLAALHWGVDEVCQLLVGIGLDKYIPEFSLNKVDGPRFLELDGHKLKSMGVANHSDRVLIKKKVKAVKAKIERERKLLEKESRARTHHLLQQQKQQQQQPVV